VFDVLEIPAGTPGGLPLQVEIDTDIPRKRFACDVAACKGACCTRPGGRGAPLLDDELDDLNASLGAAGEYLSDRSRKTLVERGPVEGSPGDFTTTCIGDRDCVFVTYEGNIAKCALEKAYLEKGGRWRKPLSCHLFPFRIDGGLVERIRFEFLDECRPAIEKGEEQGVYVTEFAKEALIRHFGAPAYDAIESYCHSRRNHR
jgi:hypothetical protein